MTEYTEQDINAEQDALASYLDNLGGFETPEAAIAWYAFVRFGKLAITMNEINQNLRVLLEMLDPLVEKLVNNDAAS